MVAYEGNAVLCAGAEGFGALFETLKGDQVGFDLALGLFEGAFARAWGLVVVARLVVSRWVRVGVVEKGVIVEDVTHGVHADLEGFLEAGERGEWAVLIKRVGMRMMRGLLGTGSNMVVEPEEVGLFVFDIFLFVSGERWRTVRISMGGPFAEEMRAGFTWERVH